MKITKLNLTNYRDARALPIVLNPKLNVFVGVNGSGKSTVLDAIAIMLSRAVSKICSGASGKGGSIAEHDITNGKSTSSIQLSCETEGETIKWKLSKVRKGHVASEGKSKLQELNDYATGIQSKISETSEKVNLPLFVYYPVNRAVVEIPLRIRGKHRFDLLAAYDGALSSGANFKTFFEWFREREDLENEIMRGRQITLFELDPSGEYQFPDPQLEAVRSALTKFLPDFSDFTIRRSPLRMEVTKNGERLTVNQLSDGEKILIAMIGDLARRMAIANPDSTEPLKGSGIVLIDEIDLHLHPKWQRMIVPKLLEVFPNCQFILSTHSPHVITHVHPEKLFLLKQTDSGIAARKPNESYGKNVDRVLEDLMGLKTTRPNEVASDLHSIFEAIDAGKLEAARSQITDLMQKIGADPELVKAEVLIKRRELIGK